MGSLLGSGGGGGLLDLFLQHRGVAVHEVRQSAQILSVEKVNSDLGLNHMIISQLRYVI